MSPRRKYLPLVLLSLAASALTLSLNAHGSRTDAPRQLSLITLQPSGDVIESLHPISALSTSEDGQTLYTVDGMTGAVEAYGSRDSGRLSRLGKALGAVRGPRGYSASAERGQKVTVWDPAGRLAASFETVPADSLAFLGNGELLVASPADGYLLHVYSPQGQLLRSFGAFKQLDRDEDQNRFLQRGRALADAAGNVYYVYRYVPLIQKYAPDGALLYETWVTGAAVAVQQGVAERFFSNRRADEVGGIHILTAAALDRRTGHLWVGMNGSSDTAVIYEYGDRGEKLGEYALEADSPFGRVRITGVMDIALTSSDLHVLTTAYQVRSFGRGARRAERLTRPSPPPQFENFALLDASWTHSFVAGPAAVQTTCGTSQTWDSCTFTCPGPACTGGTPTPTSSTGVRLDCRAAIQASLGGSYTVIRSSCNQFTPGANAQHMRGGCTSSVTVCIDGTNTDHTATLDCPAPPCTPPASGGNSDGVIDGRDSIFSSLRLWQDANHNGVSEPAELRALPSLGVARLHLDYKESKRTDASGNRFRYRAKVDDARGSKAGRWACDVFLVHGQ